MKRCSFLRLVSLAMLASASSAPFADAQSAASTVAQPNSVASQGRLPQHDRLLPLQGGQNSRDLGGYATKDGRHVRWGKLFRSGSMYSFTAGDFAYLRKAGVQTVIDFRSSQERALEPSRWPDGTAPRTLSEDYEQSFGAMMGER
ncbi:MAG TPA: tyrosine-protein phosphatase, partial [Pseudorhodoplanes sp.]|nr:tyrosine-protein phosphatase [Pseudorhodoplanes sp.]